MNWKRLAVTGLACAGLVYVTSSGLSVMGSGKFKRAAKIVEARHHVSVMARDATESFMADNPDGSKHRLCPSASKPVPELASAVSGKTYQSKAEEWQVDKAANAGFACLQFFVEEPQRYQYFYEATASTFVVRARGDLDGNGIYSTFEIAGRVEDNKVVLARMVETSPEE
jgi:hypothetical protein